MLRGCYIDGQGLPNFGYPTPRKDGYIRPGVAIRLYFLHQGDQRMADVGSFYAVLCIKFRLKRQNA
jgi:hypothetical protein